MNALVTTVKVTEFYCFLAAGNLFSQKKKSLYWLCFWALIVLPLSPLQSKKKTCWFSFGFTATFLRHGKVVTYKAVLLDNPFPSLRLCVYETPTKWYIWLQQLHISLKQGFVLSWDLKFLKYKNESFMVLCIFIAACEVLRLFPGQHYDYQ